MCLHLSLLHTYKCMCTDAYIHVYICLCVCTELFVYLYVYKETCIISILERVLSSHLSSFPFFLFPSLSLKCGAPCLCHIPMLMWRCLLPPPRQRPHLTPPSPLPLRSSRGSIPSSAPPTSVHGSIWDRCTQTPPIPHISHLFRYFHHPLFLQNGNSIQAE